ncbi:related to alpha glucosidase II beta subunit [Lecanosticta acicola]|uniref:Glucosidase 2 subunit beta n=1 Tax=Lecanosticta acicola TaxID=111012 RepID=A0AAI8YSF7_9PEZI|nr:related to alpha glucosidase II beta subunit [Lecanosticta acicola]
MKSVVVALAALQYASSVSAASTPRGVGPEFAQFYQDTKRFTCVSNPKITVPFSRVNDDYCDCPDGSDEPGTSACAHLSPLSPHTPADSIPSAVNVTAVLPGFYCQNKGHLPSYVPFTNVNDGICDYELCCDGSEEWEGVGGVKCKDKCDEIGKEWRKHDEARQKGRSKALKKREELVQEAKRLRQQIQDRLQSLTTEKEGQEIKVKNLERELAEVRKSEAGKVVKSSGGTGGKIGQLVDLGSRRTEELRSKLKDVRFKLTDSQSRLKQLESIMSTFHEEYNPNFNDEGVKRAVKAWEDYIAGSGSQDQPNDATERDLDEIVKSDAENGLDWTAYAEEEEEELVAIYSFLEYLPPSLRGWLDDSLRSLRQTLIDNGILASSPSSTPNESKKVQDARAALEAAQKDHETHAKTLQETTEDLARDFGPEDVFRALKDRCVERDSGEYTYELCYLAKTTQKPKKGGGNTNMGNYVGLTTLAVDEDLPPNGKGLGSGERIAMKYENGQHCWNGPHRSTTVVLACWEEDEIWKIMEEEKCVYRMEVGTPAVCAEGDNHVRAGKAGGAGGKDEL